MSMKTEWNQEWQEKHVQSDDVIRCQQNIEILKSMKNTLQTELDSFHPEYGRLTFADRIKLGSIKDKINALQKAIAAFQMQIPAKPVRNGEYVTPKCPCCGIRLGEKLSDGYVEEFTDILICNCGQRIDWSELE